MRRWALAIATLVGGAAVVLGTTNLVFPAPEIRNAAVVWSESLGTERQGSQQAASPALTRAGDTLIYSEGQSLTGLDPNTGAIRWKATGTPAREGWIGDHFIIGQDDRAMVSRNQPSPPTTPKPERRSGRTPRRAPSCIRWPRLRTAWPSPSTAAGGKRDS